MSYAEIEKYVLLEHLGNGAFGSVYRAHDRALNAEKAIKVLNASNPNEITKQLEEAQILHKCKHKNIVHVNEANIYEINSIPHIVIDMEYLPEGSFEKAIKEGPLSIHSSIQIIIDCLFALEHAHFNGVLHRDVKPANIMLCRYGAKLSDFGLATVLGLNVAGSPNGYTTHLPPEYFSERKTTELTDIFAVGMTLFRAVNYIQDWDNLIQSLPQPMNLVYSGTLAASIGYAPFIPLKLKRIINKAISPDPSQRYKSASEFRQALEKLRLNIDWMPMADNIFTGSDTKSGCQYHIELSSTSRSVNIDLKKNGRKRLQDCVSFSNKDQAYQHLYNHIGATLFV